MKIINLKSAIRNARKNIVLSFAKLFGLILSLTVFLFAAGYVYYETSFDRFVPDSDKIYRCIMTGKIDGNDADFAVTSPEMAPAIANEIPEIEKAIRIMAQGNATFQYDNEIIEAGQLLMAEAGFFPFFGIPLVTETDDPFVSPNDITISKSLAIKHFGSVEGALNKVVGFRGENSTITGVFEDFPKNFHLQSGIIQSLKDSNPDEIGWDAQNYFTYFKTGIAGLNPDDLSLKISKTAYSHWHDEIDGAAAQSFDDLKFSSDLYLLFIAEPLKNIHFSNHKFDPGVTSSKTYVYGAIILAILVLLISSINFINLTIANISSRLKEIGIRKTAGAFNNHIIAQFLYESFIFWIIGFVLAFLINQLAGSSIEEYLGFEIALSNSGLIKLIAYSFPGLMIFNLVINFLPISFLPNKKVLKLIKEETRVNRRFSWKESFVFMQFVLSALIILSSVFVQKQINYLVSKDRGYDAENVMMLAMWEMDSQVRKSFIDELRTYSQIKSIATSDVYFGQDPSMNSAFFENFDNHFHTSVLPVDDSFMETYNLSLKEGRFFNPERESDFNTVLLNETAVKSYQGEGEIIGKNVLIGDNSYQVIGIVNDFNFRSLHHKIQPLVIRRVENFGNVSIKLNNNQISEVVAIMKTLWDKYNISSPLNYSFHDEVIANHYEKDQQAKKLLLLLSLVSIAIACIGLYAISYFTVIRKTKEIGIRKVNGANIFVLMAMLNRQFLSWVIIAFIVAIPVSWYAMSQWLENFAYKTNLSWWVFVLTGLLATGIALLTISWQSWRAATRNPVEALRYE